MAYLDEDQDPAHAAASIGATVPDPKQPPDPMQGMDPETAQKFKTMKAFLSILPQTPATPPPRMPAAMDPEVARAAQERTSALAGLQGVVGLRSVTPYDVKQGIRPSIQSSPGYEAAVKAANLPVEQETARVAASGKQADIYNKWLEAQAGRESKGSIADVAALAKYLGTEASTANAQTRAGATVSAAHISARAKLDAIKAQLEAGTLSPEAIERLADQTNTTGQQPRLPGRGPAVSAQSARVANRAAQKATESGAAPLASAAADYGANKASLAKLTATSDQVSAFEGTAKPNLAVLLEKAKKISDSGSPWLNRPLRSWDQNALGSDEMAAFNAARQIVAPEVARVLQTATGNGILSDSARHEVDRILDPNATIGQIVASANVILRDFDNRKASWAAQKQEVRGRISGQPAGKTWVKNQVNTKTGEKRGVYSDGSYGPAQ